MIKWITLSFTENKPEISTNAINSLGYLVVLIGSFIYIEIIICNFYGFNTNIKKFLDKRENEESTLLREAELNESQSEKESADSDNEDDKSN